jgi:hypothetical protein
MASIFNLNFMPTAQPEWRSIATPKSAKSLDGGDYSSSISLGQSNEGLVEEDSQHSPAPEPASGKQNRDTNNGIIPGIAAEDMEERMQANLSGETTIMSLVDGINPEDIIYANFTSSDKTAGKLPNHFIVLDHEKKCVVLSFRGTFSLSEAITDVNCLPEEFSLGGEEGFAHVAMLNGAKMGLSVLEETLLAIVACYPEHRLWIVGHSLGAGVASLFGIILKDKHPELPIECWCFGCPGVLSLNLARKVPTYFAHDTRDKAFSPPLSFMHAFAAGDDNIPRLSHGSILDLTSMADELWVFFDSKRDGFLSALSYSLRSARGGSLKWIVNALLTIALVTLIGVLGYSAKVFIFLQSLFRWRRSDPCPDHLKETVQMIDKVYDVSEPEEMEEKEDIIRRMPTLFRNMAISQPSSVHNSISDMDALDSPSNLDSPPPPPSRLRMSKRMGSFIEVARRAKSIHQRDKLVRKAAKKFLMAAHHEKLYPPANVYHIKFSANNVSYSRNPLKYYGLEPSKPEYFGWLLFSAGMLLHHLPRSYLQALSVLGKSIKARRKKAQERWKEIRRKSRLATILSRLNYMPNFTIEVVDKLERASDSVKRWYDSIEQVGQTDSLHLPCQGKIKSAKKSVKDQFKARSAWKRARVKTSAIQHLSKAEERLQNALQNIAEKQKDMEILSGASARDLGLSDRRKG